MPDRNDLLASVCDVPRYLFRYRDADPMELVGRFVLHEHKETRTFSSDFQKSMLKEMMVDPFRRGQVFVFCSEHDDLTAKLCALHVLRRTGIELHSCRWHAMRGGVQESISLFGDLMPKPRLLVVSNVYEGSTSLKKEKLIDLLEDAGDSSVILAGSGSDPVTYMRTLRRSMTGFAWLPAKRTRTAFE